VAVPEVTDGDPAEGAFDIAEMGFVENCGGGSLKLGAGSLLGA
jgi:hypothetical protein